MHFPLLQDLLIFMGFSAIVVYALQRIQLPSILGFLVTGILIGPHGLGLVSESEQIELISEIGVILLLFVIGMELSIKHLVSIKNTVFIGGSLQVGLTILVAGSGYYFLGNSWEESLFVGFLFSLSSTAIVLKVLQDRNEMSAPQGRNALAILIFQDIIVVPMMLFTPIIAGQGSDVTGSILMLLLKTAVVILITILSARYLVPRLMHGIAKTDSQELFLITTITICFAVAFLTAEAGLSLALGAFLAGLVISESEYSHQATSVILPFRELFTSFFFISVGMLLDLQFFWGNIGIVMLIVVAVFFIKSIIAALAIAVLKYPPRTFLLTGLALFQVGEFAFILSKVGIQYDLLDPETNQYFLAVSIVSMLLTPFVIIFSERIAFGVMKFRPIEAWDRKMVASKERDHSVATDQLHNHLVIIGYGINGSNLARAAEFSDIPYVAVEMDAETVKAEQKKGVPILYGDARQDHIMEAVNIPKARVVVIAISDPEGTKVVVQNIRMVSQSVHLIVRTRFVKEIPELIALGADDVIPEEFETSIEIFSRTLHYFLIPEDDIGHFAEITRSNNYGLFQNKKSIPRTFRPGKYPEFDITCLKVRTDNRRIVGKTLSELDVRNQYGINILGLSRKNTLITNSGPDEILLQRDILYVTGKQESIDQFRKAIE
ncbi:monovalent cation:proton antiporter family protein [Phaeodactylibacter sp.]|uniref:monovalent cation:proton antiporter family protein n=1 Tax=Phaeodactylibacter sp. TaxID=1940289 RepID=UPI0025F66CCA|nr:monovalent cation:proton antiporter family protein [Phaeodactylibacter sp.]MCI4647471.1 monovalent cation:proton antiporter-2 (CPA2) family protein [Phaeodactylibacter sp.]MCI5094649.1 monovalent cation:proton antiporter-2 (CPA2) family protein [Phaeodactylibacter sp.]